MKLIDKSALVAEIEKRKGMCDNHYGDYWNGCYNTFTDILSFINTLEVKEEEEEPVSEGLDMEIDYYLRELQSFKSEHGIDCYTVSIEDMNEICRHFANWQKEQDQSIIELAEDHAMFAGMEKMKEQMMKDAIPANILTNQHGNKYIQSWSRLKQYDKYKNGDEVKLIIIKQEKE